MDVSEPYEQGYNQPTSPFQNGIASNPSSKPSGLTLVLPALKAGKPVKGGKQSKQRLGSYGLQEEEKKAPRPVKLKPLKEVLARLITQIKKKDDYAFFLKPVDTTQVPGYTDVVKRPMDFGTMSLKVERGKYRSLEDFAADLRLVASNAKAFNPPDSIYYKEAERIEAWGLDHIAKASATVIQYETDWNIEIEKDDEATPLVVDDDESYSIGTPMDVDDVGAGRRSPSVASQVQPGTSRRSVRGPYKKAGPSDKLTESIDAEGRLPGSRDGLGAFPAGSDWAKTMLVLKLKGKRYKTKKERLRVEKEGPPLRADGSLDYTEMEDPFSVLSVFAPEPYSRPYVTPLRPPLPSTPSFQLQYDLSSLRSQSQPPAIPAPFPTSINMSVDRPSPQLPIATTSTAQRPVHDKRRFWAVVRNATRSKGKDREDDAEPADASVWQTPRETHTTDYGSYAALAGALEEEIRRRNLVAPQGEEEDKVLQVVRETLDCGVSAGTALSETVKNDTGLPIHDYWSTQRAAAAEAYIRDLVYGGVDGLAYVRSLAEFVTPCHHDTDISRPPLGPSLATWVEREIVDPLTDGRHALLRETAVELARQILKSSITTPLHHTGDRAGRPISSLVGNSLHLYPPATVALAALLQIQTHKIDMGSLIKTPDELFQSEEEWAGKVFRERRKAKGTNVVKTEELNGDQGLEMEEPERTWMEVDASSKRLNGQDAEYGLEGPEELREVMEYVADVIIALGKKLKEERTSSSTAPAGVSISSGALDDKVKPESTGAGENPALRDLRLNLLALAKRAPLDTIARLPRDLASITNFSPRVLCRSRLGHYGSNALVFQPIPARSETSNICSSKRPKHSLSTSASVHGDSGTPTACNEEGMSMGNSLRFVPFQRWKDCPHMELWPRRSGVFSRGIDAGLARISSDVSTSHACIHFPSWGCGKNQPAP
ncbi:putative bromo domain containing protein [Lyophyllum shimeji]|uniref:Bromo domain containing protein n=1 Tax=Lyophyllum shimeji TaxID=47721 RepID=A0A9P3PTK7_LYOSH|nr:putative bromo domain containing protein [Lyophyllum shimeji]